MTVSDVDTGETSFQAATIAGAYGSLTIDTAGNWTYTADNTLAAIQQLDQGESLPDTLTVRAFDNTPHNIVITINGTDDLSVIGGTTTGSVTEDGTLTSTGALSISDIDTSDPTNFVNVTPQASDNGYGTFEMTGNSWTFTLNNAHAAIQALDAGETLTDTYTFSAPDGESQQVSVTIHGAEDTPVFDSTAIIIATEDTAYSYTITTNDVDVETVTITATTLPTWLTLTDNGDGTATLTGTPLNVNVGNNNVVLNVSDGSVSSNQSFTLVVANTNDVPTDLLVNPGVPTVVENATTGTVVATLSTVDPDTGDTQTFSIVGADTNFKIVGNELRVKAGATLDYETATSHSITLRVTDSGSLTRDETFTISVTDIDEFDVITPIDNDSTVNTVTENSANGTAVGITAFASDADQSNNTVTYSLTNNAGGPGQSGLNLQLIKSVT